jgi:hypothetical protein
MVVQSDHDDDVFQDLCQCAAHGLPGTLLERPLALLAIPEA